jgi:Zn-dependent protease with chaperone function
MALDPRLRSPKEKPLLVVATVVSSLVWLVLVVTVVGILYGALIGGLVAIAQAALLAHVRGNGLRVSERQLPDLHARVRAASSALGLAAPPEVYVLQAGGALNALAVRFFSRRFVVLFSDVVDACRDPRQLDFVVGHELGHHAAGHLARNLFLLPARLVPLLGAAYSRACEYTCDRVGATVAGDTEQAKRGLVVLAAGGRIAASANLEVFAEQAREAGGFWMAVNELAASHPYLSKRVAALQEWVAPGSAPAARRNVLAYPLAPLLGFGAGASGAGSAMAVFAVIGVLAAIAIPNFVKYQERVREAAAAQTGAGEADDAIEPPAAPAARGAITARCASCQETFTTRKFGAQKCPHCGAELFLADPKGKRAR